LEREVLPPAFQARDKARLEDVLATAIAYTSWAVARDVPDQTRVLVTGGGAFNPALMDGLTKASRGRGIEWIVPDGTLVEGKEALVFAWLGLLRWLGLPNALPSVTGARESTSGGALWGPGPTFL
jgi:anhydro-N-acetylmuramic acid kinase